MKIENYKVSGVSGNYEGTVNGNKIPHGSGQIVYTDGWRWTGEWKNGLPHGRGVSIKPDGECYDGFAFEDKMEGKAIFTSTDGTKYSGVYKNNKKEGVFFMTNSSHLVFEVIFKNDEEISKRMVNIETELFLTSKSREEGGYFGGSITIAINGANGNSTVSCELDDPIWTIAQKYQIQKRILPKTKAFHSAHLKLVEEKNEALANGKFETTKWPHNPLYTANQIYYRFFFGGKMIEYQKTLRDYVAESDIGKLNYFTFSMPLCAGLRGNPFSFHWYLPYPSDGPEADVFTYLVYLERKKASSNRKIAQETKKLVEFDQQEKEWLGRVRDV